MGKTTNPKRIEKTQAMAMARFVLTSPRKTNLVAELIRGKSVAQALNQLAFCRKRVAKDVEQVLRSAIANAETNHGLDVDRLVVTEATVGKSIVLKRVHARARGRAARIEKPYSRLRIVVSEAQENEQA